MYLNGTTVKIRSGRHLSGTFPIRIVLKDVPSPLLCNFAFEYALRKVQVKEERVGVKLELSHMH